MSAQLQLYRDDLKKQDEEERKITAKAEHEKNEKLRLERKESSEAPATSLDNFSNGNDPVEKSEGLPRIEKRLCCIGRRCHLVQHKKKFTSTQVGNRAGPKKYSTCRVFEPALKKVLEIEKYLYQLLMEPTDDIFKLLEGLSFLMGDSRYGAIQRRNYYEEMMRVPKIREILKIPEEREPEYKCPEPARRAMVMMAATFGIALDRQIPTEPFHGFTHEEANSMLGRDEGEEEDRDT